MQKTSHQVAVIGAGIAGIATAYYLARTHGVTGIVLIDRGQPMNFTSAQSGENYRNWWPRPEMVDFTNRSIDLLEEIARDSGNRINMTRRGYVLATRKADAGDLVEQMRAGLGQDAERLLRFHEPAAAGTYQRPESPDWQAAPDGVDILRNPDLIRSVFPNFAPPVQTVVHIRRGGDISGQQLGMYMLDYLRERGLRRVIGNVEGIRHDDDFTIDLRGADGPERIGARQIVNAAGPFADRIAAMLGVDLPIHHIFQQKIAFDDREKAIPRAQPFSIDLDAQEIDWTDDERDTLLADPGFAWLARTMPGSVHCRPDGGDGGTWVKLGWAYNGTPASATWESPLDDNFPDIVLRGAARLNPSLKTYYGQLPRAMHHYGGWYTMTQENWPLIGPMGPQGAFMNCALSGFGTMAACAAGELCAAWVTGGDLPDYGWKFSAARYEDEALMTQLRQADKGLL